MPTPTMNKRRWASSAWLLFCLAAWPLSDADAQSSPPRDAHEVPVAAALAASGAYVDAAQRAAVQASTQRAEEASRFLRRQASLEVQLGLHLYRRGEDWRAISAMRRYQALDASESATFLSNLVIGQIYHRNARFERAATTFEQAMLAAPADTARVWTYYLTLGQLCAGLDYWAECDWRLAQLHKEIGAELAGDVGALLAYQRLFVDAMLRREAAQHPERLEGLRAYEQLYTHGKGVVARAAAFEELPIKTPGLAAGLSAVLPGAGQAYLGRWGDAAIALGINAFFGAATYYAFAELESVPLGVTSSVFLAGFYAGNIYNAYAGAHQQNAAMYRDYFEGLKTNHWPEVTFTISGPTVSFGYRFGASSSSDAPSTTSSEDAPDDEVPDPPRGEMF